MRITWIALLLITTQLTVSAQEYPDREYDLERISEEIFSIQDEDINYELLYENLMQILSNPIDLNEASEEQFRSLYVLSEMQINNILQHRAENGRFLSVYELQGIEGMDQETMHRLIPFVTVDAHDEKIKSLLHRIGNESNNYLLLRYNRALENKRGFVYDSTSSTNYTGSPDRYYGRFRVASAGDFSLGFTFEKDAGEQMKWSPKSRHYGFDYNSFHVQILNKGVIKSLTLGDYQAQFGQGLVLGGGFGVGKGAESITTIRRSNVGFLPYTSLNESGFFRGMAVSIQPAKNTTLSAFISRQWIDGTTGEDSTLVYLSSISATGLHRTTRELLKRKVTLENNMGAVINYSHRTLEWGTVIHHTAYSVPLIRTPTLYNQYYFEGSRNTNVSVYANYSFHNVALFGEVANTLNNGTAFLLGMLASLTHQFDLAVLYRNYDRNYHTWYGNAFSENTTSQNESGYYLGWKYKFNKKNVVTGYTDFFRFPWLRYNGYAPSGGHEWLLRYAYHPSKSIFFYLQAREESKIKNMRESGNLYSHENALKRNYWVNLDYNINPQWSLKSRAQFSSYEFEGNTTTGFALIYDVSFKWKRLKLSGRYALFDTDDFDNRQYVYERDVWLAYSFPAYSGVGIRNYALVQYTLNKNLDMWIRWSRIQYEDRESIGTGSETIDENVMNDIKLQARIRF